MTATQPKTCPYKVGDRVEHPKLGHGTVVKVVSPGGQVKFDRGGPSAVGFAFMDYLSPSDVPAPSKKKADNDNLPSVYPPAMHPDPFKPEAAGGILCDLAKWITSTAIIKAPELSLVSSIALLAGLFGKKCLGPTTAGINIYVTTLLATAGGKGQGDSGQQVTAALKAYQKDFTTNVVKSLREAKTRGMV